LAYEYLSDKMLKGYIPRKSSSILKSKLVNSLSSNKKCIETYNTLTKIGIKIFCKTKPDQVRLLKSWFAKKHGWIFIFRLSQREENEIIFTLERSS
jgi:hypothetical protein